MLAIPLGRLVVLSCFWNCYAGDRYATHTRQVLLVWQDFYRIHIKWSNVYFLVDIWNLVPSLLHIWEEQQCLHLMWREHECCLAGCNVGLDFPSLVWYGASIFKRVYIHKSLNWVICYNCSMEEAKKNMYAFSTTTYTGFQCTVDEETSEKFKGNPRFARCFGAHPFMHHSWNSLV